MSIAETVETFFSDLLTSGNAEAETVLSETVRLRGTLAGEHHGREGFWDFLKATRLPFNGFQCELLELVAQFDSAAVKVRFSGFHRNTVLGIDRTERDVAWKAAVFFEFDEDDMMIRCEAPDARKDQF